MCVLLPEQYTLRNGLTKDDEVDDDLLGAELVLDAAAPLAAPLRPRHVAQQDGAGGHDDAPAAARGGGGEHLAPRVGPAATEEEERQTSQRGESISASAQGDTEGLRHGWVDLV